jgi:hypothetical protein
LLTGTAWNDNGLPSGEEGYGKSLENTYVANLSAYDHRIYTDRAVFV